MFVPVRNLDSGTELFTLENVHLHTLTLGKIYLLSYFYMFCTPSIFYFALLIQISPHISHLQLVFYLDENIFLSLLLYWFTIYYFICFQVASMLMTGHPSDVNQSCYFNLLNLYLHFLYINQLEVQVTMQ